MFKITGRSEIFLQVQMEPENDTDGLISFFLPFNTFIVYYLPHTLLTKGYGVKSVELIYIKLMEKRESSLLHPVVP